MNDKIYNILKWGLMIFVPAVTTLIGSLGQIILTITAIATFLGVITGISNYNYKKVSDK